MKEEWKKIEGYDNYEVSNMGRVRSLNFMRTGRVKVISSSVSRLGYHQVDIFMNGVPEKKTIHRLVAEAFLENPDNLPQINHRDGDKSNNCVENLCWCNQSYNNHHSRGWIKVNESRKKPVLQYTKTGEFIKEYSSSHEASRETGVNQGNISACCNGKQKSANNFIWKYKN